MRINNTKDRINFSSITPIITKQYNLNSIKNKFITKRTKDKFLMMDLTNYIKTHPKQDKFLYQAVDKGFDVGFLVTGDEFVKMKKANEAADIARNRVIKNADREPKFILQDVIDRDTFYILKTRVEEIFK